jgi:phosphatidylserine/phosphatidylglycerophosphate/cardiolipin synthase-like enzyme
MRFRSSKVGGFRVFAVTGTNTVSFGIEASAAARKGLLGFAVERIDHAENQQFFMYGFKVFESVIPHPDENTQVSTFDQPVQSFVWDDFTGKPGRSYTYRFHPLRGKPKNLDRSATPIEIDVQIEDLFSKTATHQVFFNRGVASSQAYSRRFGTEQLGDLPPKKQQEARDWLSRDLDEAILAFIHQVRPGDTLLGCFYEFRYEPVAKALREKAKKADVRIIIDAKDNSSTDQHGVFHEAFPREENLRLIEKLKFPKACIIHREARRGAIQHNKFMVWLKGKGASAKPAEVWTGSTNLSDGGIHGQTNVGHWVRDADVADAFRRYWDLLHDDPGGETGDDASTVRNKNKALRRGVMSLGDAPEAPDEIVAGITPVFSPREGLAVLDCYADLVDVAKRSTAVTLAFGVSQVFKDKLVDNTKQSQITFLLLEKRDKPRAGSKKVFVALTAKNNVYSAWGSFLRHPLYQWTRETTAGLLHLNTHVSFIHSKFLLHDPLGGDPIVVTGSANFSDPSTRENDENMLVIRGDRRVADIYFTEFNRLWNHYYFRSVVEALEGRGQALPDDSLFLREDDTWTRKYAAGTLRSKRLALYTDMSL